MENSNINKVKRKPWTKEELLLAINLYCRTPFGRIHVKNPEIIALAKVLGRTPGSVSYKLANFASLDPSLARKGATNVSKMDREVWNDFFENWDEMTFKSETMYHEVNNQQLVDFENLTIPEGKTRDSLVRIRVNQNFFRKMVLASYDSSCCITGLSVPELLVASHIIPWAKDSKNRMNPQNGLCLNILHDKAFDAGLITVDENFNVVLSSTIKHLTLGQPEMFLEYENIKIRLPNRFIPDHEFLAYHRENIFLS
jgi:putative restriction endonuclease